MPDQTLQVICMSVGWLMTNCYLVWDPQSREALIIDPGAQARDILAQVNENRLTIRAIVNTHGHADHLEANREVQKATQAPIMIHAADAHLLQDPVANLSKSFGIPVTSPAADEVLTTGRELSVGPECLTVLETPGHSPGSICLSGPGVLFSGDTLFAGSIGRTDIPGGDEHIILKSIQEKLLKLPIETRIYPGHGPATTLKSELSDNPYLVSLVKS